MLHQRVAARHLFIPQTVCALQILFLVHREIVARVLAAENVELAVDDPESIRIAAPGNAIGNAVGAVAAELRGEFGGRSFECSGVVRALKTSRSRPRALPHDPQYL